MCEVQQPRTVILQRRSQACLFPERVDYFCGVFSPLFVQLPRRGCFLSMFSVRHEDVFIERSNRSQASSSPDWDMESNNIPKTQYTKWGKLCLDPVQTEFYCSSKQQRDRRCLLPSSGNISSACPLSKEKVRLKCFHVHYCVFLVSIHLAAQKMPN